MKELNITLAENIGELLLQLQEEVAKGLEDFWQLNNNLLLEKA